jgi:hypothetical protein
MKDDRETFEINIPASNKPEYHQTITKLNHADMQGVDIFMDNNKGFRFILKNGLTIQWHEVANYPEYFKVETSKIN